MIPYVKRIQLNPGIQQKAAAGTVRTEQSLTLPREQGLAMASATEYTKSCNRSCRRRRGHPHVTGPALAEQSGAEPLVGWWASPVLGTKVPPVSRSPPFLHWQPLSLPSEDILKDTEKPPEKVTTLTGRRRRGARQRRREWEGDLSLALRQTFFDFNTRTVSPLFK